MGRLTAPAPLAAHHHLDDFDCGNSTLNDWLRRCAVKNETTGASRTFVARDSEEHVVGYYALATGAVAREDAHGRGRRNMPDPIPVMVLGRLAVDMRWQNRNVGKGLLKDAIQRTLIVAQQVGVRALLVHAISEEARDFYLRRGFHECTLNSMTLMITLAEAKRVLAQSTKPSSYR